MRLAVNDGEKQHDAASWLEYNAYRIDRKRELGHLNCVKSVRVVIASMIINFELTIVITSQR